MLLAKEALGNLPPKFNEDLLDIQSNYFDKGDMFWVALDEANRVIGMIGTNTVSETDMWLKRLFIKPTWKRQGLGSALFAVAEEYAKSKGIANIHTRFAKFYSEAAAFYPAKGFVEAEKIEGKDYLRHMVKEINK